MLTVAKEIFEAYLNSLCQGGEQACADYHYPKAWTHRATLALIAAGRVALSTAEAAAKGHPDRYGQSEYLTLDVLLYNPETDLKPPLFIAEHENSPDPKRVQYAAWKLLIVESRWRMLVAYFGEDCGIKSFDNLEELVREVCKHNPGKDILLIGADYNVEPKTVKELRLIHKTAIIGSK